MDMDNSVVIAGVGRWTEVKEGIRGMNGTGKNTIKKQMCIIFLMLHTAKGGKKRHLPEVYNSNRLHINSM